MDAVKVTRAQQIAAKIRLSLLKGGYICGERLIENNLRLEMKTSQSTIRDAFRILIEEGWLVYRPRHGVYVRAFTAEEAEELYALWASLELLAFDWALENHSRVELLTELRMSIESARLFVDSYQWGATREALFNFHQTIADLSRRPQTMRLLEQIINQALLLDVNYELVRGVSESEQESRVQAYEHLLGVIKFGTMRTVKQALTEHIAENGKRIIKWLAMNA